MHSHLRDTFSVLPRARWKAAAITISPDFRQLARSRKALLVPCARAAVVSEEIRPFDAAGILTDKEKAPVPNYVRRIRRDKDKNLSLSLLRLKRTHPTTKRTRSLKAKSGRDWWMEAGRLDVKYLLVISGESARMDRRLIVVTYAFRTRDICRVRQNGRKNRFFLFLEGEPRMAERSSSHVSFSSVFRSLPLPRESREFVIYLFLEPCRERNRITYYVSRDYGLHSRAINERGPSDR